MINSNERIIKPKIGLLNLAEELGNVSQACKIMGLSRDTFYRYKEAVDDGGVEALLETSRRKPNRKNRVDDLTEQGFPSTQLTYRPVAKFEQVMSCVNWECLSHPVACAASGSGITWLVLKIG